MGAILGDPPTQDSSVPSLPLLRRLTITAAIAIIVAYGLPPVYTFPDATPFAGPRLFNPYARTTDAGWLKVNLHAHSRAWGGVTNGQGSASDVRAAYARMGYDVAGVSNYFDPERAPGSMSVYEQGFNLAKSHLLAVGGTTVDWMDLPFVESASEKEARIDRLTSEGALPIMVHPELRDSYSAGDMRRLTGYAALEVASHFGTAFEYWNAALDAGRPVWAVGGDDSHNLHDATQLGRAWTMVAAPHATRNAIISAIRSGRTYAVTGRAGRADVWLDRLDVRGDTVDVHTSGAPASISFVGQGGRELVLRHGARDAEFVLPADAPYVRVVVQSATTALYLNPVIRTWGTVPYAPAASVNGPATDLQRLTALLCALLLIPLAVRRESPALADALVVTLPRREQKPRRRRRAA